MVNSSAKGALFERWVCQRLSRLIDPAGRETHFWRTSMSGGRSTLQRRRGIKNEAQLGDIGAITEHAQAKKLVRLFLIECKHVKDLNLMAGLFKGKGKLHHFWLKLSQEGKSVNRHPMLIARQNNFGTLLILTSFGLVQLRFLHYVAPFMTAKLADQTVKVCWFKDLLQTEDFLK